LKGDFGELELETPRDRQATFEPKIVAKGQTRWTGFDDKIISLYARGMTTREIQGHLEEMYKIEVSPTLISNVTDAVIEEVFADEVVNLLADFFGTRRWGGRLFCRRRGSHDRASLGVTTAD
jgi:transposase-like protein